MSGKADIRLIRDTLAPGLFCAAMIGGLVLSITGDVWPKQSDFTMFYAAGMLIRESPATLYDPQRQAEAESRATGLDIQPESPHFTPFGYPPVTAIVYSPLTFLNHRTAYFLMALCNALLLAVALRLLATRLRLTAYANLTLWFCALALLSTHVAFLQGQISFVILLLFVLMVTDLSAGRSVRSGLWAGLIVIKPTLLPVSLFWFAVRREWRALAIAISVCFAAAVISIALVGPAAIPAYRDISARSLRGDFANFKAINMMLGMQNLRAVTEFFKAGTVVWLLMVSGVLATVAFMRRQDWGSSSDLCALVLATVLAAPHIFVQDVDLILIVVALTLHQRGRIESPGLRWLLLGAMLPPFIYYSGITQWPIVPMTLSVVFCFFALGFAARHRVRMSAI